MAYVLAMVLLTIKANHNIQISGNVTILADGDVSIWNKASIEILPNSSLSLYFKGNLTFSAIHPWTGRTSRA